MGVDMNGYTGYILRVNLTTSQITTEELSTNTVHRTVGGRGLAAEILLSELPAGIDPLGPDNKLVVATGPFQNTPIPGGTRIAICAKSPLTGGWGEANAAGSFGPMLKQAGYDAIIVEGEAPTPVYLWVSDEGVELRDASNLWGLSTGDTLEAVRTQAQEKAEVAAIGCAGEKLVRYASVIIDYDRATGRSGMGAVMGAKRLKAIATYGRRQTPFADGQRVRELAKEAVACFVASPDTDSWRTYGTAGGVAAANALGSYPVKNYREGFSDEELIKKITGQTMVERGILRTNTGCIGCPNRCHLHATVSGGPYGPVDPKYGGPEFETIGIFGSNLGIYDPEYIARANQLCNMHGLDTLNTGGIIGWAFECYERGIITKRDTGGLELEWGSAAAALGLLEHIAYRRGIGDLLADGIKEAIATFGPETAAFAMHVKNQTFAVHMPRARMGQALSYATSNRGACHLQGMHDTTIEAGRIAADIGIDERFKGVSRFSRELKPEFEVKAQHWRAVQDSLIVCKFTSWDYGPMKADLIIHLLNAITGDSYSAEKIQWIGERTFNACRLFNTREGFSRQDDVLPKRVGEPMSRGSAKGSIITLENLQEMLDRYYDLRGWNANGIPTGEKLQLLKLPTR
jgi:aldehyde:ferredoxin oxidoreductase